MESEKVKEIKKALECCKENEDTNSCAYCYRCPFCERSSCQCVLFQETLTLINELESENERLSKSDTSKEESSIEYYNLYKDLKRKNKDLNELCELQRVSIAESFVRENQLKDRIAELEKENAIKTDTITDLLNKQEFYEKDKLTKFAERLKDEIADTKQFFRSCTDRDYCGLTEARIDEILNEFIDYKNL